MNIFHFTQKTAQAIDTKKNADSITTTPSTTFKQQSEETAFANQQLNRLLDRYKEILAEESNEKRMNLVRKWSAAYPRVELETADSVKQAKPLANDMKKRTRLAANELHHLENEGGPPPSAEQNAHAEHLTKASANLNRIAPLIRDDKVH